jgi:hypothetical protein
VQGKQTNDEPVYKVVSPVATKISDTANAAGAVLSDLNGKTVCELDGRAFRANETLAIIRAMLRARYPGVKFVKAGEIFSPSSQDQAAGIREKSLAELRAALLQSGCDAVITGNGA